MKRRRERNKETWEDFEKRVGLKRTGGQNRTEKSNAKVPNDILVQRMSSAASGRLKKYEPLDTRDFVPFSEYDELSTENIKEACEHFYNAPAGSCDILASDRGPSCTKIDQIKGKKVYFIRFLPPIEDGRSMNDQLPGGGMNRPRSTPRDHTVKGKAAADRNVSVPPLTAFPKSVSIGDLLKAGKLVKPQKTVALDLELFDLGKSVWLKTYSPQMHIQAEKFASGGFRDAFRATCAAPSSRLQGDWVIKTYQQSARETIRNVLKMTAEDHTRKQVQMHAIARNITQRFSSKVPPEFGESFEYGKVFYSQWSGSPVTVEEYVTGDFQKYVNNDGRCIDSPSEEFDEVFLKAQCLVHFSFVFSKGSLMILDLQGSMYQLYDPEIATYELMDNSDSCEFYFCAGNMSRLSIDKFKEEHVCI